MNDYDPWREAWRGYRRNPGAVIGLVTLACLVLIALLAPWLAPYDPAAQHTDAFLLAPSWHAGGSARFLLGTDDLGRDVLSRLIFGARLSLSVALGVVCMALVPGVALGALAAHRGGAIETAIMRIMDILLALPSLLLAIVIVAVLGEGLGNAALAVSIVLLPHFVRVTRAAVASELSRDYVTAARLDGARGAALFSRVVLPNVAAPLIVQSTLSFSSAILDIAALGFLGLGAQPPEPEWGTLLSSAREFIERAPWIVTLPGVMILLTVLAGNLMGDGLRDALDPRLKR